MPTLRQGTTSWLLGHDFGRVFRKYLKNADERTLRNFFNDISRCDTQTLLRHREMLSEPELVPFGPADLLPAAVVPLKTAARSMARDAQAGAEAISAGQVGAVAFAGGAATRFKDGIEDVTGALPATPERLGEGVDAGAPKGCFPIGPVEGLSFYEMFIAQALETGIRARRLPHSMLMTSAVTARGTMKWLSRASLWEMPREAVTVFSQNENPRLDADGELLVS